MRTIPNLVDKLKPMKDTIRHHFLKKLLNGHEVDDRERERDP